MGQERLMVSMRLKVILVVGAILIGGALSYKAIRRSPMVQKLKGEKTVDSVMETYGDIAHGRLRLKFEKAGVAYPPKKLLMLGLKSEESLEIYAGDDADKINYRFVCKYPILGCSGVLGPKLREGDGQMPEGFYRIRELEPNTPFHVALRVNYPSEFDKEKGISDNRTNLGSDIMIHGSNCSIGCLAMGDPASEEIFVLVHDVGIANTELHMSPIDFRKPPENVPLPESPSWIVEVYSKLKSRLQNLKAG